MNKSVDRLHDSGVEGPYLGLMVRSHLLNDCVGEGIRGRGDLVLEKSMVQLGYPKLLVNGIQLLSCLLMLMFDVSYTAM